MSYEAFYRYIRFMHGKYWIIKNNELYMDCETLAEALYERDRLIGVDWDWDRYVQLADTPNNYIHIDLPPFEHKPRYISRESEAWVVKHKGAESKYMGSYRTEEEAKRVALTYNARVWRKPLRFVVRRKINGKTIHYGKYKTLEEAEKRVEELEMNGWKK